MDQSYPATLVVSLFGEGQFNRIGDAVKAAPTGACILVRRGIYQECLVLEKRLTIRGDGPSGTVILENQGGCCLRMKMAESAVVQNIAFDCRAGRANVRCPGIEVVKGHLVIADCLVSCDSQDCVYAKGGETHLHVERCKIYGSKHAGIAITGYGTATVEDSDIFGHQVAGVLVWDHSKVLVKRSRIRHCEGDGLWVTDCSRVRAEETKVYGNEGVAVRSERGSEVTVRSCRIRGEGVSRLLARSIATGVGTGMLLPFSGVAITWGASRAARTGGGWIGLYPFLLLGAGIAAGLVTGLVSAARSLRRKTIEGKIIETEESFTGWMMIE